HVYDQLAVGDGRRDRGHAADRGAVLLHAAHLHQRDRDPGHGGEGMIGLRASRLRVVAALELIFNLFALNFVLVLACLPVVTIPAAFQSAIVALDRWRDGGEDRVLREFVGALRSRQMLDTTLVTGTPFVATAIAWEEVHHFARGGTAIDSLCMGLGVAGLLLSVASLGYVLVLAA